MNLIKIMDADLANKIAAGEVIENQASVVKELVENSIDAQADLIEVALIDDGLQLIQVNDNGIGMSKEDILLCFHPHASSKLLSKYELFNISSLGFRGEALASINAVAKVEVFSNDNQGEGYHYVPLANQLSVGYANKGSKFIINNLFYNVPARLKYLKSQKSELANIIDLISRFALAYPSIAFTLTNNNKILFKTKGDNKLLGIIARVFNDEVASNLIEVKSEDSDFKINGYISNNQVSRSNKKGINIFLNKRLISDKQLEKAILNGYDQYLMEKRFPYVFLNIECDPQLVDVNVHPSKKEVRISQIEKLKDLIEEMIRSFLLVKQKSFIKPIEQAYQNEIEFTYTKDVEKDIIEKELVEDILIYEEQSEDKVYIREDDDIESNVKTTNISFKALAQFASTYIIAQSQHGMHLIDQHAAMERINYEKKVEKFNQQAITYQTLITPMIIDLTLAEKTKLLTFENKLAEIGIKIESLANNDIIIREIPSWISYEKANESVQQIIDYLLSQGKVNPLMINNDDLISASCKMSLKANHNLSLDEQQKLLDQLLLTDNYDHCPHGRPIIITLSLEDIERMFKRIN